MVKDSIRIKEQDLILKVKNNVDIKIWDESKYYRFLEIFTQNRNYQTEAILTALKFMCSNQYSNIQELAIENYNDNVSLQEKYGDIENFLNKIDFSQNYTTNLDLATGTGKSWVMYALAYIMLAENKVDQVLILVPSVTIEEELIKKFKNFSTDQNLNSILNTVPPKIINGAESVVKNTICIENRDAIYNNTRSSIIDSLEGKGNRTLILSDEAHHIYYSKENNWRKFIEKINFKYNIGLSGTCYYDNNDYFTNVIYRYSLKQGIEDKQVKSIEYVTEGNMPLKKEDKWSVIINSHESIKKNLDRLPISLVVTHTINTCKKEALEFKKRLQEEFSISENEVNEKVIVVHSKTEIDDLVKLKNVDTKTSKVEWIFSVSMLTEGWDVKRVFQIIPHEERAFNSKLLIAQVMGRGLRIPSDWNYSNEGFPKVIIFNHHNWSKGVKKLVEEVLEFEKKISSAIIIDSEYNFELDQIDYIPETNTIITKKEGTYNLFEKGYVVLPSDSKDELISTTFSNVVSDETRVWDTIVKHKTYSIEDIAIMMWDRFEDVPDDNNAGLAYLYKSMWPIEKLKKIIMKSLEESGNTVITDKIKQSFLTGLNVIFRNSTTSIEYKYKPTNFLKLNTTQMRKSYVTAESLKQKKVLFWNEKTKNYLQTEEQLFLEEIIDTTNPYKQMKIDNIYDFKTPQYSIISDSEPEKIFVKELFKNEKVEKWIKSSSTGFYFIEYSWRKGEHPKRNNFNPDFFIKVKDRIIVAEVKDDNQISDPDIENIAKYKYAKMHFKLINEHLKSLGEKNQYKFTMITPKNFDLFFQKISSEDNSDIDKYRSELDYSILMKLN